MNRESFKNFAFIIYDFLYSIKLFVKKYETPFFSIIGIIISLYLTSFGNLYSKELKYLSIILFICLIAFFIYYKYYEYVPINLKEIKYSMEFIKPPLNYYFRTPELMLDEIFSTKLFFKIELNQTFKNNIKNTDDGFYYTLVIEKDKLINVNIPPEYTEDSNEMKERNIDKYYLVQEYKNQSELEYTINFTCSNKYNINKNIRIYLEYGDIHDKKKKKRLENKFFDKEIFITDLSSIIK